ncbi:hypothetical protein [Vreelandella sulfidaeris]|uniref:Uncharacterized protein n=1 Tax=Vreelandella sulfidaeris TaxID=115553 RepID=A0A455U8R0_9GAMM|nr:hypothetical protein HSBAA_29190 [Halomonas sulfidaeris]
MNDITWKSIWRSVRLILLRRKAKRLVSAVYAEFDSCGGDGGNRMKLVMRPHIAKMAKDADKVLDELSRLDPERAPKDRVYPRIQAIMQ